MLEKVQGIVLRTVKFSDTKMIVHIFTLGHGRQSFVTSISHSRQSRGQMAFWSPLSMVEFMADIRTSSSQLPKPKDVRLYYNYVDVPYNYIKSSVSLFLAEFLAAILRDEAANTPLYKYIETSLQWFDQLSSPKALANFHLIFLFRLTRFIGILPNLAKPDTSSVTLLPVFDLQASEYRFSLPPHHNYLSPEESSLLPLLLRVNYSTMHLLCMSKAQRSRFLEVLETYYRLHLPSFPEIKSIPILHEVFS